MLERLVGTECQTLVSLLDILTVDNIYRLEVLKFSHSWHNGLLPEVFDNIFQYTRNIHGYNTRYTAKQNFYKHKVKTNAGKQSVSCIAIDIWKDLPSSFSNSLIIHVALTQPEHLILVRRMGLETQ